MKLFWKIYLLSGWSVALFLTAILIYNSEKALPLEPRLPEPPALALPAAQEAILNARAAIRKPVTRYTARRDSSKALWSPGALQRAKLPEPGFKVSIAGETRSDSDTVAVSAAPEVVSSDPKPLNVEALALPDKVAAISKKPGGVFEVQTGFESEEFIKQKNDYLIYIKPHEHFPEGGWLKYRRFSKINENGAQKVRFFTESGNRIVSAAAVEWNQEIRVE